MKVIIRLTCQEQDDYVECVLPPHKKGTPHKYKDKRADITVRQLHELANMCIKVFNAKTEFDKIVVGGALREHLKTLGVDIL